MCQLTLKKDGNGLVGNVEKLNLLEMQPPEPSKTPNSDMKKFEYKRLRRSITVQRSPEEAMKLLTQDCNEAGSNGWEVICVVNLPSTFYDEAAWIAVLKREVPQPRKRHTGIK